MFDTKYYKIVQLENDADEYCWAVVNKQYNTCEHKSYTLPGAIAVCVALSEQLDEIMEEGPTLTVVRNETLN